MNRVDPMLFGLGVSSIIGGTVLTAGHYHSLVSGWVLIGFGIVSIVMAILVRRKK